MSESAASTLLPNSSSDALASVQSRLHSALATEDQPEQKNRREAKRLWSGYIAICLVLLGLMRIRPNEAAETKRVIGELEALISQARVEMAAPIGTAVSLPTPPQSQETPETVQLEPGRLNAESLPEDIISPDELAQEYHTAIISTDDVRLHLRRYILQDQPIFPYLKDHPQDSLTIILVDGPDLRRKFIPKKVQEAHEQMMQVLKDKEDAGVSVVGRYEVIPETDDNGVTSRKFYILIASERPGKSGNRMKEIYEYNKSGGDIIVDTTEVDPEQSYPKGGDLHLGDDLAYPIRERTPGLALDHEFGHFGPDARDYVSAHPLPDQKIIERLKEAEQLLREGDSSGYYYIFETRKGNTYTLAGNEGPKAV